MSCNTNNTNNTNNNMKQTKIYDYYSKVIPLNNNKEKKVYGYNKETHSWHCINCGIDMGHNNSRQLCGKTYCSNAY
jgi:hypothetical protein